MVPKNERCLACNGRGRYQILRNVYACRQTCPECDGTGRTVIAGSSSTKGPPIGDIIVWLREQGYSVERRSERAFSHPPTEGTQ